MTAYEFNLYLVVATVLTIVSACAYLTERKWYIAAWFAMCLCLAAPLWWGKISVWLS